MSITKRNITKEKIIHTYTEEGIKGIKKLFSAEAMFFKFQSSEIDEFFKTLNWEKLEENIKDWCNESTIKC